MRKSAIFLAAAMLALPAYPAAQEAEPPPALREAHAVLLGLDLGGVRRETDDAADIYYSIVDDPAAPRLVTRLEIAVNPCRSRIISGLQFPGEWASLTLSLVDLARIDRVAAYASVDDMIAGTNEIPVGDPAVRQVVLTGAGLSCSSRLSLASADEAEENACGDRIDLSMMDEDQQESGRRALAVIADMCRVEALKPR